MIALQQTTRSIFVNSASQYQQLFKQTIIPPVAKPVLTAELALHRCMKTSKGLELYCLTAHQAPYVMQEVSRIREVEFRRRGGGTGKAADIDRFDTGSVPYQQLVVWDPQAQEIVSAYRYMMGDSIASSTQELPLASSELFLFSQQFQQNYLPYTLELGRMVVNQQATRRFFGMHALWCSVGSLIQHYSKLRYIFARVTISYLPHHPLALDLLLQFLQYYYADLDQLVIPKAEVSIPCSISVPNFVALPTETNAHPGYTALQHQLAALGQSFPAMLRSYIKLTPATRYCGAVLDAKFGYTVEAAILIPIHQISSVTLSRYA